MRWSHLCPIQSLAPTAQTDCEYAAGYPGVGSFSFPDAATTKWPSRAALRQASATLRLAPGNFKLRLMMGMWLLTAALMPSTTVEGLKYRFRFATFTP